MRSLTIRGPSAPMADASEGGDYAIVEDGQIIAETFFRSSPEHTHDARANALLFRAALDLLEVAQAIEAALRFAPAAEVLDENSPIRGALRDAIAKATAGERP